MQIASTILVPRPAPFAQVALRLFDRVDADQDGFVSASETRAALNDASYEGLDAAAVATFTRARHSAGALSRLSNDEWGPERRGVSRDDLLAVEGSKLEPLLEEKFRLAKRSAERYSPELFSGSAIGSETAQGSVGDCWLLAAAASQAAVDPSALMERFAATDGGNYTVWLGDDTTMEVAPPTQAECAAFGTSGAGGHWVSVLEKAVGQGRFSQGLPQLNLAPRSVGSGLRVLTGDSVDHDFFRWTGIERTREKLQDHLKNGEAVVVGTGPDLLPGLLGPGKQAQGLVPGHCYAVLDYNEESDQVTLQNPYGDTEWSGADDGVNDGTFDMPLKEMHRMFSDIAYQQSS